MLLPLGRGGGAENPRDATAVYVASVERIRCAVMARSPPAASPADPSITVCFASPIATPATDRQTARAITSSPFNTKSAERRDAERNKTVAMFRTEAFAIHCVLLPAILLSAYTFLLHTKRIIPPKRNCYAHPYQRARHTIKDLYFVSFTVLLSFIFHFAFFPKQTFSKLFGHFVAFSVVKF